ncbi:sigma-54 interaction domain-containing protein [Virgibacillus sediminis]|uniref:Sigma-54 interaction domain-containing protein n=1 Tax=Virgibacillus sediminis TaxID=202260 RepID=A0ABV7A8T7_9BACI
MKNPVIFVMTKEVSLYYTFRDKVKEIFGNHIQLRSNHFPPVDLKEVDLILWSGADELYHDLVDSNTIKAPVITANRTVDFNKLERLFQLKQGTRCLLVSNTEEGAYESVDLLNRLGFDYLDITPFSNDMEVLPEVTNMDVAITYGLAHLVPDGVKQIIDLGNRSLDLSTLFEIAKELNQDLEHANHMTMDYVKNFVRIGKELAALADEQRYINSQLEAVLDAAQEGIIFVNSVGKITLINDQASSILGISEKEAYSQHYTDIIPAFPIEEGSNRVQETQERMVRVNGRDLLTILNPITVSDKFLGSVVIFQDISHVQRLEQEIRRRKSDAGLIARYTFGDIMGMSDRLTETKKMAKRMAGTDLSVLITGESGTGKELFAQAIHQASSRRNGPFVAVNFAGLTESIAESELFGYEEGSFTGARKGGRMGLFELAQHGTLFLDEIGDASEKIQASILRVLQEKQVMRVGGNKVIPVDIRIIAATNKNLNRMMENKGFREDLFYRLNQLPLRIPALRERKEDIHSLIEYFLRKHSITMNFTSKMVEEIERYNWPGNARELEAFIHYLSVTVEGNEADLDSMPPQMKEELLGESSTNRAIQYLEKKGDLPVYKEILECLALHSTVNRGIGRAALLPMIQTPLSDSQLRTKLQILKESKCVVTGVKKQGTRITNLGLKVLEEL